MIPQKRHIVTVHNYREAIEHLDSFDTIAIDTETTGLFPYKGDRLFSIIATTDTDNYYFNYNTVPDNHGVEIFPEYILPRDSIGLFSMLLNDPRKTIYMQNAKFDMHMLYAEGKFRFRAKIFCTKMGARLVNNQLTSYSLEYLGHLLGFEKDDQVKIYANKNKLYDEIDLGKKEPFREYHYELIPFHLITNYGFRDGEVTYLLGRYIEQRIEEISKEYEIHGLDPQSIYRVLEMEMDLTKALFRMEKEGVKINRSYVEDAYKYEVLQYQKAAREFEELTGLEFSDSRKILKPAFDKLGLDHGYTTKGNPSFKDELLPDNELGEIIRSYRSAYKKATTYYKNFLYYADDNDIIHCSFDQSGTATGRFSSRDPNMQNVPKEQPDDLYKVRQCFIPKEGKIYVMLDYDQMEYRLLLDYANEENVIKAILEEGLDVHQATGNEMGVKRTPAKTLNFMLLYGGGAQKLADALKCSLAMAKNIKQKYFSSLRKISTIVKSIISTAEKRGYGITWLGRKLLSDKNYSYKMPNHVIQGGCGDIVKIAMVEIDKFLSDKNSCMVLQIHDELILEVDPSEAATVIPEVKRIMQDSYPYKYIPLTVGVDYSTTDWYNKNEYAIN